MCRSCFKLVFSALAYISFIVNLHWLEISEYEVATWLATELPPMDLISLYWAPAYVQWLKLKGCVPALMFGWRHKPRQIRAGPVGAHFLSAPNTVTSTLSRQDLDTFGFKSQAVAFKWCGLGPVTHPPQTSESVLLKQKHLQYVAVARTKQE